MKKGRGGGRSGGGGGFDSRRGSRDERPKREGSRREFGGGSERGPKRREFGGGSDRGPKREGSRREFGGGSERGPKREGSRREFGSGSDRGPKREGTRREFGSDRGPRRGDAPRGFDRGPRREEPRRDVGRGEERPQRFDRPRREEQPRGEGNPRYIYGVNPVLEAVRAKPERIEHLFIAEGHVQPSVAGELLSRARDAGIRTERVQRERLNALAEGGVHQGVVAEVRLFDYAELPDLIDRAKASGEPPLLVVLDGIQDPHNLGAIIRSAHALGAHGVVIAKDRAAQVTGVVAKSSAGAIEHCPIARVVNIARALEELKEAGLWTVAADPEGDKLLPEAKLDGPLAIVIGAEGEGVREGVLKASDFRVKIPMGGQVGSLNASVSAAILLYEVVRQRRAPRA